MAGTKACEPTQINLLTVGLAGEIDFNQSID
jgi:hypothetical protein